MDLAKQFKALRIQKEFSVYRLSKESDVSENYIRSIEKGKSQPSVFVLGKLLSSLGVTLPEFLNENREIMYPSDFERELVETVRQLSNEKAATILHLAKLMKS